MINAKIDVFETSHEETVSCINSLKTLELLRRTNGPGPPTLSVYVKNRVSVTIIVGKSSQNAKAPNTWCQYCDKNNHITATYETISRFEQIMTCIEYKAGSGKNFSAFSFEEINATRSQLKSEDTASSKKRNFESPLSSDIDLNYSNYERKKTYYLFTSSNSFSSSKTKQEKSYHLKIYH
jgi:hypothetical protein